MIELASRARKDKELDQQQTDFTAEGAPAPGRVGAVIPAVPTPKQKRISHGPVVLPSDSLRSARSG